MTLEDLKTKEAYARFDAVYGCGLYYAYVEHRGSIWSLAVDYIGYDDKHHRKFVHDYRSYAAMVRKLERFFPDQVTEWRMLDYAAPINRLIESFPPDPADCDEDEE